VRYIAPGASNKRVLIVSRLAVVLLGCWALYQAIYAPSILEKMLYAYTIYSAALTPVVLAAFYSKRATAWGAVAAIATGTVVTLAWDAPGRQAFLHLPAHPRRARRHLPRALRRRRRAHRRQRRHATTRPEPRIAHSRCSLIGLAIILPELLLPISRILTQPRRFE
jgi:hypothetical protein